MRVQSPSHSDEGVGGHAPGQASAVGEHLRSSGNVAQGTTRSGAGVSCLATVVVRAQGDEAALLDTLKGLERQTTREFEVLIWGEATGCEESSRRPVHGAELDLRFITMSSDVLVASRNCAVLDARGSYVFDLDAGDVLEPTAIEKCMWAFETRPRAGAVVLDGFSGLDQGGGGGLADERIGRSGPPVGAIVRGATVYRRAAWHQVGSFREAAPADVVDADCCLRMAKRRWTVVPIHEELVHCVTARPISLEGSVWLREHYPSYFARFSRARFQGEPSAQAHTTNRPWEWAIDRVVEKAEAEGLVKLRQWRRHPLTSALRFLPERFKGQWWTRMGLPRRPDAWKEVPPLLDMPRSSCIKHAPHVVSTKGFTRVLFIHPWLITGGAETVILSILKYIDRNRFETHLVITEPGHGDCPWMNHPRYPEFAAQTDRIYNLPAFIDDDYRLRFIVDLIESRRIDVLVVSLSAFGYHALPQIRARFPDVAIVDLLHAEAPYAPLDHITLASKYRDFIDRRVVVSESLASLQVSKYEETPDRIAVIPNGVDVEHLFNPTLYGPGAFRREIGIGDGVSIVLFFGRIAAEKQPMHIVEVADRMRDRPDIVFALMGEGAERPAVEAEVERRGLRNVVMCPSRDDVAVALADARIVFFPSKREGLPMAGIEAMSMGVPIVASDVPGWADLITDGIEGLLVDDRDIDAYAAAIARFIDDDALHATASRACRMRAVDQYDVRSTVRLWETVLVEAARRNRS